MGLYNFDARLVPFILDETKTHTIRSTRLHPDTPGKIMHLYTGLRQKGSRLLMRVPCVHVEEISIAQDHSILIGGQALSADECESLASRDGFPSFADMMSFWAGRLPFRGHVYHWDPKRKLP